MRRITAQKQGRVDIKCDRSLSVRDIRTCNVTATFADPRLCLGARLPAIGSIVSSSRLHTRRIEGHATIAQ